MMERRVRVAVPAPFHFPLDYLVPDIEVRPGQRLLVPLGRRRVVGIAMEAPRNVATDGLNCRPVEDCLDMEPLVPDDLLALCRWAAAYYHHPIGEVLAAALPASLRAVRRPDAGRPRRRSGDAEDDAMSPGSVGTRKDAPVATADQAQVLAGIEAVGTGFAVHLIEGVTGSGKTEIYLRAIDHIVERGGQALVLTPEIGLTPQLLERFRRRFGTRAQAFHSGLTERERRLVWLAARQGRCRVLIGTRSAVFVPLPELAMVVVDEEHDISFKQQDGFRYSARDTAIFRGRLAGAPVLLGSATPCLESLHNAAAGRYHLWQIQARAQDRRMPAIGLIDMRGRRVRDGLSAPLLDALQQHTAAGGQALMFLNRRGFAPALLCHDCGWVLPCPGCDARMTVHRLSACMICHHCGNQAPVALRCGQCGGTGLTPVGQGTERLEQALAAEFPDLPVLRIDSDRVSRAGELDRLLDEIHSGRPAIVVGTQMLAKGHDFSRLSLVGVIDADAALFSADFRAVERMGQLLTQVAGRAGRGERPGEVLIQTHQPQHPALVRWLREGYRGLAESLLDERRAAGLPPSAHLALVRADSLRAASAEAFLREVATTLEGQQVEVMGPIPAPMERRAGRYRYQLLLRCPHRPRLQAALARAAPLWPQIEGARRLRWSLDVDPQDLF